MLVITKNQRVRRGVSSVALAVLLTGVAACGNSTPGAAPGSSTDPAPTTAALATPPGAPGGRGGTAGGVPRPRKSS